MLLLGLSHNLWLLAASIMAIPPDQPRGHYGQLRLSLGPTEPALSISHAKLEPSAERLCFYIDFTLRCGQIGLAAVAVLCSLKTPPSLQSARAIGYTYKRHPVCTDESLARRDMLPVTLLTCQFIYKHLSPARPCR